MRCFATERFSKEGEGRCVFKWAKLHLYPGESSFTLYTISIGIIRGVSIQQNASQEFSNETIAKNLVMKLFPHPPSRAKSQKGAADASRWIPLTAFVCHPLFLFRFPSLSPPLSY